MLHPRYVLHWVVSVRFLPFLICLARGIHHVDQHICIQQVIQKPGAEGPSRKMRPHFIQRYPQYLPNGDIYCLSGITGVVYNLILKNIKLQRKSNQNYATNNLKKFSACMFSDLSCLHPKPPLLHESMVYTEGETENMKKKYIPERLVS